MVRIILEDIKINKNRNVVSKKEEVALIDKIEKKQEEIEVKIQDSKIDEYLRTSSRSKQRLERTPQVKSTSGGFNKFIFFLAVITFIGGIVYWGGNLFQKVDVNVTSKHQEITYNNKQFTILKESSDSNDNILIMIYPETKLKKIILTEPKEVSAKSKGSIILYNAFSATPQKILAGTFVADSNGKSYKTDSTVTIPGYSLDKTKKIIPGEVVANISSFLEGEAYNGAPTDFYITSFKGTPKYTKIYGKLKSPLVGGASGLVYTLNNSDIAQLNKLAESSFKEDLLKKAKASVYPGYIYYPNAMTFSYKIDENVLSKTPEAEISIVGLLSVVLIKEKSLIDNIIKISLPQISGDELKEINIVDLNNLIFNFTNKDQVISKDLNSVSFYLSGKVNAVWNPDVELLKFKLIGINKNEVLSIFRLDPGISSASVKFFPPWVNYFPNNTSKINININ